MVEVEGAEDEFVFDGVGDVVDEIVPGTEIGFVLSVAGAVGNVSDAPFAETGLPLSIGHNCPEVRPVMAVREHCSAGCETQVPDTHGHRCKHQIGANTVVLPGSQNLLICGGRIMPRPRTLGRWCTLGHHHQKA